jgi:hypothetical protein
MDGSLLSILSIWLLSTVVLTLIYGDDRIIVRYNNTWDAEALAGWTEANNTETGLPRRWLVGLIPPPSFASTDATNNDDYNITTKGTFPPRYRSPICSQWRVSGAAG